MIADFDFFVFVFAFCFFSCFVLFVVVVFETNSKQFEYNIARNTIA